MGKKYILFVYAFWALIAGTNLKEFIKDVRFDVYTPYGKWMKDSTYRTHYGILSMLIWSTIIHFVRRLAR